MQLLVRYWQAHQQLRYLLIGALNTAVGYAIFATLYLLLQHSFNYMAIALMTHIIAATQSFITQRIFVFRSRGNSLAEYLRFHAAHLVTLVLGLTLLSAVVEVFGISPLVAQAITTVITVLANYFIHQHFTFRRAKNV